MLGHVGDVASAFAETPMASVCWCKIPVIIWHRSLMYFGFTRVLWFSDLRCNITWSPRAGGHLLGTSQKSYVWGLHFDHCDTNCIVIPLDLFIVLELCLHHLHMCCNHSPSPCLICRTLLALWQTTSLHISNPSYVKIKILHKSPYLTFIGSCNNSTALHILTALPLHYRFKDRAMVIWAWVTKEAPFSVGALQLWNQWKRRGLMLGINIDGFSSDSSAKNWLAIVRTRVDAVWLFPHPWVIQNKMYPGISRTQAIQLCLFSINQLALPRMW